MSSGQKLLTRRHLLSLAGGAAGIAVAGKALAGALRPADAKSAGQRSPRGGAVPARKDAGSPAAVVDGTVARAPATAVPPGPVDAAADARQPAPASPEVLAAHTQLPKPQTIVSTPQAAGPVMRPLTIPAAGAAVASLFGSIRAGTELAGCRVVRVHDLHLGAVPVVLETSAGSRFQVDVLRRGSGAAGVADAGRVSVFLSNEGSGRSRTHESHGLAAMALASALSHQRSGRLPSALLTLEQRSRRFPRGGFAVPLQIA